MTDSSEASNWPPRRILLTGGTGKLGGAFVKAAPADCQFVHYSRRNPDDGHPWIQGDLRDRPALDAAMAGIDAVVHAAALHGPSWKAVGDDEAFQVNVTGTRNVLEAAHAAGVRRVVYASSIYAAGHGPETQTLPHTEASELLPTTAYGMTKRLSEELCRFYALRREMSVIVLRPGFILDAEPHDERNPMLLFGGVNARDVASAHWLAVKAPLAIRYDCFIIVADSPLAQVSKVAFEADPAVALEQAAPEIARLLERGELDLTQLPGWYARDWYSIKHAQTSLGYAPQFNYSASSEA